MLTLLAWLAAPSFAQDADLPAIDLDRFRPALEGYVVTRSATTLRPGRVALGVWGQYAHELWMFAAEGDDAVVSVIERSVVDLQAAVGLHERVSLGVDVPVLLWQDFAGYYGPVTGPRREGLSVQGLGDVRVEPRVLLHERREGVPLSLAVHTEITLPTATRQALIGEGWPTITPMLVAEVADGSVREREHTVRAALNVGARIKGVDRPAPRYDDVAFGPELMVRAAGAARVSPGVELGTDLTGALGAAGAPLEVMPWLSLSPTYEVSIAMGVGFGVLPERGSPDARFFAGATLRPGASPPPPPDADADGVLDADDQCPAVPEDLDGDRDDDGCPEEDPVPVQVAEPEPEPGPEAPRDSDGDGLLDPDDACPFDAEDPDGFQDDDGCPDEGPSRVVVTSTALEIDDRIFFALGRAVIQPQSFPILEELAKVILEHPHIERIAVEGHTDDVGSDVVNLRLSQRRAEAVRDFLVAKGVDPSRLEAVGFGESRPIDTNRTDSGRARNRRVEFTILEQQNR